MEGETESEEEQISLLDGERSEIEEIEAIRDDRSYVLIANFVNGYAAGWKMAVRDCFKDSLDIKMTPRISKNKTVSVWTQGRAYNFSVGDIIYDTAEAYQVWSAAIKHIKLNVQVQSARPAGLVDYETLEVKGENLKIMSEKGPKKSRIKNVKHILIRKQRRDHGYVCFRVFRSGDDPSGMKQAELIECTQDDFVAFLQTGVVRTLDYQSLNLFSP